MYTDNWKNTNRSITVVTAFFDIGGFPKGSIKDIRTAKTYTTWMQVYKYLQNPLVIYTDSKEYINVLTKLRENSTSPTKIILVSRDSLWSFKIKPEISKIYANPGYPKRYPSTYIPDYSCTMHSKIPLVAQTINSGLFPSDYYCWLDLGYFREKVASRKLFYLEVPSDFDPSKIAFTRVINANLEIASPKSILRQTYNWIGGGLFLGKPEVLIHFEVQYKSCVLYYLSQGLSNVDQSILYAMYTKEGRSKVPVNIEVQTYIPGTKKVISNDPWFYLGYLMYHETHSTY